MPFELATFIKMFRLAFAERMSKRRRRVVVSLLILIPVLAAINAVCLLLDHVFFPGFRRMQVRKPVFIIGHARSGTSLLHRLMTADEGRFVYFRMYEMLVPSLVQKKLIRAVARLDRRYLDSRIARRIEAWEDRTFAKGRQMHPMSLGGPEEDEFLLALSCASGVWMTVFPYMRELDYLYYFDDRPAPRRRRVLEFYRACVKRQLYLEGPGRVLCSKNPVFCGKVESLIEAFPDARFVILARNPLETIPSLLKMMERNWRASDCDRERMDDSLARLAEQSFHSYRYPFEVLARHPEVKHAIIEYPELVENPRRTMEALYERLGLDISPEFAQVLAEEEKRSRSHRAEHVYTLEEFGLAGAEIRTELADLFERFGWTDEETGRAVR